VLTADAVDRRGADVADQDLGAGLGQVPDQTAADLADISRFPGDTNFN